MQDKSQEEIQGLLQGWPEVFAEKFGRKLTKSELLAHLQKTYNDLIEKQIKTVFDAYSPNSLLITIDEIKQGDFEFIEHDLSYHMETPRDPEIGYIQQPPQSLDQALTMQPVTQEVVKDPSKKKKSKWGVNFG